jgi:hypothetical protein
MKTMKKILTLTLLALSVLGFSQTLEVENLKINENLITTGENLLPDRVITLDTINDKVTETNVTKVTSLSFQNLADSISKNNTFDSLNVTYSVDAKVINADSVDCEVFEADKLTILNSTAETTPASATGIGVKNDNATANRVNSIGFGASGIFQSGMLNTWVDANTNNLSLYNWTGGAISEKIRIEGDSVKAFGTFQLNDSSVTSITTGDTLLTKEYADTAYEGGGDSYFTETDNNTINGNDTLESTYHKGKLLPPDDGMLLEYEGIEIGCYPESGVFYFGNTADYQKYIVFLSRSIHIEGDNDTILNVAHMDEEDTVFTITLDTTFINNYAKFSGGSNLRGLISETLEEDVTIDFSEKTIEFIGNFITIEYSDDPDNKYIVLETDGSGIYIYGNTGDEDFDNTIYYYADVRHDFMVAEDTVMKLTHDTIYATVPIKLGTSSSVLKDSSGNLHAETDTFKIVGNALINDNLEVGDTTKTAVLIVGTDTTDNLNFAGYFTETTNKTINSNDTLKTIILEAGLGNFEEVYSNSSSDLKSLKIDGKYAVSASERFGWLGINDLGEWDFTNIYGKATVMQSLRSEDTLYFGNLFNYDVNIVSNNDTLIVNADSLRLNANVSISGNLTVDGTYPSDFVFDENYELPVFNDYIDKAKELKHLPEFENVNRKNIGRYISGLEEALEKQLLYNEQQQTIINELIKRIEKLENK